MPIAHPERPGHRDHRRARCRGNRPTAGKTWAPFKGAPGGEDYQNGWINPDNPGHHPARRRSGRGRHAQRRRDVELLVQPADRRSSITSRPTTRFRIASAAGSRRADRSASSSRGNYGAIIGSRLAAGRRRRIRLRRARSAESRHRLRRPNVTRFDRRTGQVLGRRARRRPRRRWRRTRGHVPQVRTMPVVFSEVDKRVAVLREQPSLEDGRRRRELEADQPRPDARRPGPCRRASASTRATQAAQPARARRDLHRRAVLPGHQPHLGRAPTTA